MENEKINCFAHHFYQVNIFAEDPDKEDTGFFFTIIPYDENNIPSGDPIFDSSKEYICETQEQAEEDAMNWVDDYDEVYF